MLEKLQNGQNWLFQINSDHFGKKIFEKSQNSQNWPFQINLDHFGRKYWKDCKTAKIGHSESIQTTSLGNIIKVAKWAKFKPPH